MTRRGAQNPRHRKDDLGKTRKSAASAKPKRTAGEKSSGGSYSSKKKAAQPQVTGWRRFLQPLPTPDTPEFKRWRKIWGGLFVAGVIFTLFSLYQWKTQIGTYSLFAAYACLFSAIFIDITKIRRMRREWAEGQGGTGGSKGGKKASSSGSGSSAGKKGDA